MLGIYFPEHIDFKCNKRHLEVPLVAFLLAKSSAEIITPSLSQSSQNMDYLYCKNTPFVAREDLNIFCNK